MGHGIKTLDRGVLYENAWHRHPQYTVTGQPVTAEEIADVFDFEIEARPVYILDAEGEPVEVPGRFAQVRTDADLPLSIMSGSYAPPDYRERFAQVHRVLTGEGAEFECHTAGTLHNGAKAFMSFRLPDECSFDLGGTEVVHSYLNVGDSSDGSSAFRGTNTLARVVCANTFSAYLVGAPSLWSIRHTSNSGELVDDLLKTLHNSITAATTAAKGIDRLMEEIWTEAQFVEMIKDERILNWEARDAKAADGKSTTRVDNTFDAMMTRYHADDIADIRETKFGALMAVQGYEQHVKSTRGMTKEIRHLDNVLFKTQKVTTAAAELMGVVPV